MLTLLFAVSSVTVSAHFGCGTDDHEHHVVQNMNIKPKNMHKHSILEGRAQDPIANSTYEKIRISYSTSQLESDWIGYDKLSYFKNDVIPAAYEWLQNVISVMPVNGPLTFDVCNKNSGTVWVGGLNDGQCVQPKPTWQTCGDSGATVPTYMFDEEEICPTSDGACSSANFPQGSGMANTDLMIYFTGDKTKDDTDRCKNVMGFAGPCHSNSRNRPIAGNLNLCRSTLEASTVNWEESVAIIIHETFHILGFLDSYFEYYKDGEFLSKFIDVTTGLPRTDVYRTIIKRGEKRAVVTLPTVVEKAKAFFDCDEIDGIELENGYDGQIDGKPSSHWENRIIVNDFMVSYVPAAPSYGIFTLAVLADSGFYQIDWKYAQEPPHGRGIGCKWYNNKCIDSNVESIDDSIFCTEDIKYSCGASYVGAYVCEIATYPKSLPAAEQYFESSKQGGEMRFPDYCPLLQQVTQTDCRVYGDNNIGAEAIDQELLGGFVSGNSKCAVIGGSLNPIGVACYPTECFINYKGEYVGTRITHYRNYKYSAFDVLTCWSDESNTVAKELNYGYESGKNYGFTKVYCPVFKDICYDENPWICTGHGTRVDGKCVCSPGYIGIDCSIENNKVNRETYDAISGSVNVYQDTVCNGGGDFSYKDDDDNVGILKIKIDGITSGYYTEIHFQTAIQNWIAILTDISLCDTDLRSYTYANNIVTVDVYYYSSSKTWNQVTESEQISVFNKLFDSTSNTFNVEQEKESKGHHEDNNASLGINKKVYMYMYAMILVIVAYLL